MDIGESLRVGKLCIRAFEIRGVALLRKATNPLDGPPAVRRAVRLLDSSGARAFHYLLYKCCGAGSIRNRRPWLIGAV